jgi:hypothetical protein
MRPLRSQNVVMLPLVELLRDLAALVVEQLRWLGSGRTR